MPWTPSPVPGHSRWRAFDVALGGPRSTSDIRPDVSADIRDAPTLAGDVLTNRKATVSAGMRSATRTPSRVVEPGRRRCLRNACPAVAATGVTSTSAWAATLFLFPAGGTQRSTGGSGPSGCMPPMTWGPVQLPHRHGTGLATGGGAPAAVLHGLGVRRRHADSGMIDLPTRPSCSLGPVPRARPDQSSPAPRSMHFGRPSRRSIMRSPPHAAAGPPAGQTSESAASRA